MRKASLALVALLVGCNDEKVAKLEKQVQQLQTAQTANSLDLQAKCAKDAREWFGREWQSDKDTITLSYINHYNSHSNKCAIAINWNYHLGPKTIQKTMLVYDVYENKKLAEYSELHMPLLAPPNVHKGLCTVLTVECSSFEDFTKRIEPYVGQ